MTDIEKINHYKQFVSNKFHVYNSLFMNLPYEKMSNIGMLLPILSQSCESGFSKGKSPQKIIENFFKRHTSLETEAEKVDFLFRIIQYVERQVVLFDSIEDAAYKKLTAMSDGTSLNELLHIARSDDKYEEMKKKLQEFSIRVVFTAHPTQFYPPTVQGIMYDLRRAIEDNDINNIDVLLQQLGKTSFLNAIKPTPYEEAKSIIYYLRHVYYDAIGQIFDMIDDDIIQDEPFTNTDFIRIGFWPGGDRDGNPFVTAQITKEVTNELRMTLMKCYYNNLKVLRRKLTFRGVEPILTPLSEKLYKNMFSIDKVINFDEIMEPLLAVKKLLIEKHNSLYLDSLNSFINRVNIFKVHFATLDIRQDSRVHDAAIRAIYEQYEISKKPFDELSHSERIDILTKTSLNIDADKFEDPLIKDTIENIKQLKMIQQLNGEEGCNRYIISNSEDIYAVFNVYALFKFCGWADDDITFDIIPLFETIRGMANAEDVMTELFNHPVYAAHLKRRKDNHTIMLGFSDGTKDGGYLKANWEIYKTKELLTKVCNDHNIKVVFFDGRGGPPARGGGKTHKFYASQGKSIANHEIQLTIQGQTITSKFGTVDQFIYNSEQLLSAGIANDIMHSEKKVIDPKSRSMMDEMANISFKKYEALKMHPSFIPYLEEMSTLKYYGKANIGSRPGKRGHKKQLELSDLRAISFVGSWSQLKQNVPGYFGIGTAIQQMKSAGRFDEVKQVFEKVPFFKALILNSMMSITKSFFPLTAYMKNDPKFGEFWTILYDEYELSKDMMKEILGYEILMEEEPISKSSIDIRESIVLPLVTIQQYALQKIKEDTVTKGTYETMVMRSLFGNINASRNSA